MVRPVQSPISAPFMPFQQTAISPLYQDQFGISTLTQVTAIRKPLIAVGIFAVVALLVIFLKRFFSAKSDPTDIPAWVESNCADLNLTHRKKAELVIIQIRELQKFGIINVKAAMNDLYQKTYPFCVCNQCNTTKDHVLRISNKIKWLSHWQLT